MRPLLLLLTSLFLCITPLPAQQNSGEPETQPRLAGIVDLGSLSLLWNDPSSAPEALDITMAATGPILLFSDRYLSLGHHLEMIQRTAQDLASPPRMPKGFVPARLLLNPLSEPVLYDADSGSLLLFHPGTADPERFETDFPQAVEAGSLRRGGVVLSDGRKLVVFSRRANELSLREIPLPVAFATGLSIDGSDHLWIYDLAARKVRVFDLDGGELHSVTPQISGGTLLFPQVFQVRADGGFFLGTAGELWCFKADGSVLWRLSQFSAGVRQALPAFYRLAVGTGAGGGTQALSFYILDPLGNRIMKFVEESTDVDRQPASIDGTLAAAFASPLALPQNEIVRLCLEKDLLLQAAFFRREIGGEPVVTDLSERIWAKQAGLLAGLAAELENQLRYPEAEATYNRSLSVYRELRNLDPVDPRYPEAIRELGERRNRLLEIRITESLLQARLGPDPVAAGKQGQELHVSLINTSRTAVEQLEFLARFSGYPESRWQGSLARLPASDQILLSIPFSGSRAGEAEGIASLNSEDLKLTCNLLLRFLQGRQSIVQNLQLAVVFPARTLQLPRQE